MCTNGLIRLIPPFMKQRERQQKALSLHDAALDSLHRIEAVSGLMPAASEGRDSRLDAREIEAAASIICEETTKVRNTLDLMRGLVNSAKARSER